MQLKMTEKRLAVLRALAAYHPADREPDHHQIAVACGRDYCAADWAHAPLRDLEKAGLVEVAGKRTFGGRLWRITKAGRERLKSAA